MTRKLLFFLLLIVSFSMLASCVGTVFFKSEEDEGHWIKYSYFQDRFDELPRGISASTWKSTQDENIIVYSTVLTCDDNQYQHILKVTVNNKGNILDIELTNSKAFSEDSCFAEIAFHVFCSTGYNEANDLEELKGYYGVDADWFYYYFEFSSQSDTEKGMSINNHEVTFASRTDNKTQSFIIHKMISE